jgi:phage gpG-like protein
MIQIRRIGPTDAPSGDDLRTLAARLENLPAAARAEIAGAVRAGIAENFATQSGGGPLWAPLAEMTIFDRIRKGYPGERPILIRDGSLMGSLTNPSHPDHAEIWESGEERTTLEIRSDRTVGAHFLADIHHGGADIRVYGRTPARIPARPLYNLSGDAEARIGEAITRTIDGLLRGGQ